MSRLSRNAPCPCGSGRKAKSCCAPILDGAAAPTPEALMRSRYTAFATGDVGHLMRTTHPSGPHHRVDARAWQQELRASCDALRFEGLAVHEASEDGDAGRVRFTATVRGDGEDLSFTEHSRFLRVGGRWLYFDGAGEPVDVP